VAARNAAVLGAVLIASIVGAAFATGLAVYSISHPDYAPLPWIGLALAITIPCNLLLTDLVGRQLSAEYGLMLLLKNATSLFAGSYGIYYMGVAGALIAESLSVLLTAAVLIAFHSRDLFKPAINARSEAWRVARIGFPFMLNSVVITLTLTLDRWFVQKRFGLEAFGEYSFAFLLWTSAVLFGNILSMYMTPRVVTEFARTGDLRRTYAYVHKLGLTLTALCLVAMLPVLWVVSWIIDLRYPQYVSAKPLLIPVYLGAMFWIVNYYASIFVILNKGNYILGLSGAISVLCFAVLGVATLLDAPIFWYAIVFCIFRLLHLVSSIVVVKRVLIPSAECS
jgi:O-antigen/teichoic acid export membrane protein